MYCLYVQSLNGIMVYTCTNNQQALKLGHFSNELDTLGVVPFISSAVNSVAAYYE